MRTCRVLSSLLSVWMWAEVQLSPVSSWSPAGWTVGAEEDSSRDWWTSGEAWDLPRIAPVTHKHTHTHTQTHILLLQLQPGCSSTDRKHNEVISSSLSPHGGWESSRKGPYNDVSGVNCFTYQCIKKNTRRQNTVSQWIITFLRNTEKQKHVLIVVTSGMMKLWVSSRK